MTMPFGKHRGVEVSDLPDSYIVWLLDNVELFGRLATEVEEEYHERFYRGSGGGKSGSRSDSSYSSYQPPPPPPSSSSSSSIRIDPDDSDLVLLMLNYGYKSAAKLFHPDLGGDPQMMVKLNSLIESLRKQLDELGARV